MVLLNNKQLIINRTLLLCLIVITKIAYLAHQGSFSTFASFNFFLYLHWTQTRYIFNCLPRLTCNLRSIIFCTLSNPAWLSKLWISSKAKIKNDLRHFGAIWYHLYNLKNVKNKHGGVLLLVKLQAFSLQFYWKWHSSMVVFRVF